MAITVLSGSAVSPSGTQGAVAPGQVIQTKYVEQEAELFTSDKQGPPFSNTMGIEIFNLSFTPMFANSKLLFIGTGPFAPYKTGTGIMDCYFPLFASHISSPPIYVPTGWGYGDGAIFNWSMNFLHTPGSAATQTYSMRAVCGGTSATVSVYVNGYAMTGYGLKNTMTIQEIRQ